MNLDGIDFTCDEYGFWRQVDPVPIDYTVDYKRSQSTTVEMSWLRLGWFLSVFDGSLAELRDWRVCDIGSGNGTFAVEARRVFGEVCEYDVSGDSIGLDALISADWDLVVLTDVLEHYSDINALYGVSFRHLLLSFPETPVVADWRELVGWRHFKPNEHIYNLNLAGCCRWLDDNGYDVLRSGFVEDVIRRSPSRYNVGSIVARRRE